MRPAAEHSAPADQAARYAQFGLVALILGLLFQFGSLLLAHGGDPLDMVRPAHRDGTVRSDGYDGSFFLALARDPLVGPQTLGLLDSPIIRAGRIGFPLAAHALAPITGGAAPALLLVLALSNGIAVSIVQVGASRNRLHPASCLLVPFALPFVLSAELFTSELMTSALLLAAFAAERWGRAVLAAVLLSIACLTKEVALLAVVAFVLVRAHDRDFRRAAWCASAVVPLAMWQAYLIAHLGGVRESSGLLANLAIPGEGLVGAVSFSGFELMVGHHTLKAGGLLLAVLWLLVGAALSFGLISAHITPARAAACTGGLLTLWLSHGAPAYAYDEIFNFGRQLFLLPVGMIAVLFIETAGLSRNKKLALVLWLSAGSCLGVAWWIHKIWTLSTALPGSVY